MGNAPYESVGGRSKKPKPATGPSSIAQDEHGRNSKAPQGNKEDAAPRGPAAPQNDVKDGIDTDEQEPEPPLRSLEASLTALSFMSASLAIMGPLQELDASQELAEQKTYMTPLKLAAIESEMAGSFQCKQWSVATGGRGALAA